MINWIIAAMMVLFIVSLWIGGAMIPIAGGAAIISVVLSHLIASETDLKDRQ